MLQVSSRTMETSFYADDAFMAKENIRNLKKSMTLDLGGGGGGGLVLGGGGGGAGGGGGIGGPTAAKRQKFNSLLSSPDLNLLKLASPDLENLIIEQNNGQVTTTPTPSQFLFTKNVTEEQEMYARGFVDALAELHHGTSSMDSVTTTTSNGSTNSSGVGDATTNSTSSYSLSAAIAAAQSTGGVPHHIAHPYSAAVSPNSSAAAAAGSVSGASQFVVVNIKEEPQTVPSGCSSPPLSPIDMMAQERIKLERKRQRNRVAASKCRKRKLERIARLEDKVKLLKDENTELGTVVTKLKDHICHLKQQLMDHVNSGCQIMTPSQYSN